MLQEEIKKEALGLSQKKRAQLAHLLIDSLPKETGYDSEEALAKEIKKRITKYKQGKSTARPWSDIKKEVERMVKK